MAAVRSSATVGAKNIVGSGPGSPLGSKLACVQCVAPTMIEARRTSWVTRWTAERTAASPDMSTSTIPRSVGNASTSS